jgi:hypothetical protein
MAFHRHVLRRLCYDLMSRNTVGECLGLVLTNAILHQKPWCVGWNKFAFYQIEKQRDILSINDSVDEAHRRFGNLDSLK